MFDGIRYSKVMRWFPLKLDHVFTSFLDSKGRREIGAEEVVEEKEV